jgi:hypothetical protein
MKPVNKVTKTTIHYAVQNTYNKDGSMNVNEKRYMPTGKTVEITVYEKEGDKNDK